MPKRTPGGKKTAVADVEGKLKREYPNNPGAGKVYDANLFNQLYSDYLNKGHPGMGDLRQGEEQGAPARLRPNSRYRDAVTGQEYTTDEQGNREQ